MILKRTIFVPFVLMTACYQKDWVSPKNPDPRTILYEAKVDAAAGRYKDALAKHLWFHQNALKYHSALYGVRLSFALTAWDKLGGAYPPALAKLKAIRDEAAQNARDGKESHAFFHDFASINEMLDEDHKTKELFIWLDSNKPDAAKQVYDMAQSALVKAKEYQLCGRYIDSGTSFQQIQSAYRMHRALAQDLKSEELRKRRLDFAEKLFSSSTATLVALLVLNERKADADRITDEALKEWNDVQFKKQLEKAKNGDIPPSWH